MWLCPIQTSIVFATLLQDPFTYIVNDTSRFICGLWLSNLLNITFLHPVAQFDLQCVYASVIWGLHLPLARMSLDPYTPRSHSWHCWLMDVCHCLQRVCVSSLLPPLLMWIHPCPFLSNINPIMDALCLASMQISCEINVDVLCGIACPDRCMALSVL